MSSSASSNLELINESILRYQTELYSLTAERRGDSVTSEQNDSHLGVSEMIWILGKTYYIANGIAILRDNYHFVVIGRKIWLIVIDGNREIHVFVSPANNELVNGILSERNIRNIAKHNMPIEGPASPEPTYLYTLHMTISIKWSDSHYTIWSEIFKFKKSTTDDSFSTTLEQSDVEEFIKNGGPPANEIIGLVTSEQNYSQPVVTEITPEQNDSQPGVTEMIFITGKTFHVFGGNTIPEENYHFFVIGRKIWLIVIDGNREIHVFVSPAENELVAEILSERNEKNIAKHEVSINESETSKPIHVYTLHILISIQYFESAYTVWSDIYKYRRSSLGNSFSTTLQTSDLEEFTENGGLLEEEILKLKPN